MQIARFTESEIAYMVHRLAKYALIDKDVAKVCRILVLQFSHSSLGKQVKKGENDKG